ncbi:MAG: hypothetical protein Q8P18_02980 [Pseudomonadota bacterium]|nr:hypothetical protein [Pseudomonadota bacterium]
MGEYVYADYKYGQVWSFGADRVARVVNGEGHGFVSFAEDEGGELLAVDIEEGIVYRLVEGASERWEDGLPASRLSIVGADAMPPLGRAAVDEEAVALIEAWIGAMPDSLPADCEIAAR